jgi:hypothetical protein
VLIIAAWIAYQRTQASISAYGVVERGFFGGTYGLAILFSTWSSVLGVYLTTRWWGVPMHFLTSGLCAAMFFVVLVRLGVLTESATVRSWYSSRAPGRHRPSTTQGRIRTVAHR